MWFNIFLPLIYSFRSFIPHPVINLGCLPHLFILTLLMSKPPILQSFICISSVGAFLSPSDLITDMIVHPSVTILLRLNALYLLPLIFPFWIFCVLLFLRACCCVPSRSESATAPALPCLGRRGSHTGHGRSCPAGLTALFPPSSPPRALPAPLPWDPWGTDGRGGRGCPCPGS